MHPCHVIFSFTIFFLLRTESGIKQVFVRAETWNGRRCFKIFSYKNTITSQYLLAWITWSLPYTCFIQFFYFLWYLSCCLFPLQTLVVFCLNSGTNPTGISRVLFIKGSIWCLGDNSGFLMLNCLNTFMEILMRVRTSYLNVCDCDVLYIGVVTRFSQDFVSCMVKRREITSVSRYFIYIAVR